MQILQFRPIPVSLLSRMCCPDTTMCLQRQLAWHIQIQKHKKDIDVLKYLGRQTLHKGMSLQKKF